MRFSDMDTPRVSVVITDRCWGSVRMRSLGSGCTIGLSWVVQFLLGARECVVVRVLLCHRDPALEELLRGSGHEPVRFEPGVSVEQQVAGVDALLFDPESREGSRVAVAAQAVHKPCRHLVARDTLGVSWQKIRTANQEFES